MVVKGPSARVSSTSFDTTSTTSGRFEQGKPKFAGLAILINSKLNLEREVQLEVAAIRPGPGPTPHVKAGLGELDITYYLLPTHSSNLESEVDQNKKYPWLNLVN